MLILIGLGNPGSKYTNNRHNVGHMFLDFIDPLFDCPIVKKENNKLFQSTMKQCNNEAMIFAKPKTFMNNSGIAVRKLTNHYPLTTNHLLIIHDDLDIPLGKFHIQFGVGPKLHNGLESIENHLKTKDFYRIRIGVDARPALGGGKIPGETYALQNFLPDEKTLLKTEIFPKILDQLKLHIKNQFKVIV